MTIHTHVRSTFFGALFVVILGFVLIAPGAANAADEGFDYGPYGGGDVGFDYGPYGGGDFGFDYGPYGGGDVGFDYGPYGGGDVGFDYGPYGGGDFGFDYGPYGGGDFGFDYGPYGGGDFGFDYGPYGGGDFGFDYGPYGGGDVGFDYGPYGGGDVGFSGCDYGCYEQDGVKYSYTPSSGGGGNYGYSTPRTTPGCTSCGGSRSTPPITVRNPSYPTPSYPTPPRPQPQPQPYVYNYPSSNTNVNTITNTNTNTNVNNVDNSNNSINNSFNSSVARVTPVSAYPVQYPVQYTFPQPAPIYPTYQNTYCTITATPSYIQNGQAAYLSWTSYGATSAWLSDGIGMVAPSGTLAVRPNGSTTYTLTVSGFGGTRTCQAYVNVSSASPYVALSQIPYTGFDLGTFGNAMYWMGLLSFAAAAAYLVLYYRGGASIFLPSILGGVRLPRLKRVGGVVASPVMFSNSKVESYAERPATIENLPVMNNMSAPKDSMAVKASSSGECPRIVISRG